MDGVKRHPQELKVVVQALSGRQIIITTLNGVLLEMTTSIKMIEETHPLDLNALKMMEAEVVAVEEVQALVEVAVAEETQENALNVSKLVTWQETVLTLILETKAVEAEVDQVVVEEAAELASNAMKKAIWLENVLTNKIQETVIVVEVEAEVVVNVTDANKKVILLESVLMINKMEKDHTRDREGMMVVQQEEMMTKTGIETIIIIMITMEVVVGILTAKTIMITTKMQVDLIGVIDGSNLNENN